MSSVTEGEKKHVTQSKHSQNVTSIRASNSEEHAPDELRNGNGSWYTHADASRTSRTCS